MRGRWWPWLLLVLALVPSLLISQKHSGIQIGQPQNVTEAIFSNPNSLDPALADTRADWAVDSNIFQPLFEIDSSGALTSHLVKHAALSGDTVTLTLNPVPLVGGGHLTAALVAGALARPLWPAVASGSARSLLRVVRGAAAVEAGRAKYLSGVKVVNQSTVTIQLTHRASPSFLKVLANPTLSIVPAQDMQRGGPDWQELNLYGTGGYQLTNWDPNGSLTFQRDFGRGPRVMVLDIVSSFSAALLAFDNDELQAVPVKPSQIAKVPERIRHQVRALPVPGNLYLVYRTGALRVSTYPRLSVARWVLKSFDGRLTALPGQWPSGLKRGGPMSVYVNRSLPEAVQLADTLAKLEPGRVTVVPVSRSTLDGLAHRGQINAYIGEADLFKSGQAMPVAPLSSFWLVARTFSHPVAYANGSLDWHSLTSRP